MSKVIVQLVPILQSLKSSYLILNSFIYLLYNKITIPREINKTKIIIKTAKEQKIFG